MIMRPLLNDIALFIEVVNSGGFTQAAERLDMPPSTLSRRIKVLEQRIGFKLLNRTTRRVEPTAEGYAYHQRCQTLIEEATLAHEAIVTNKNTVTGTLRLTCSSDFANLYLGTCINTYLEQNPQVSVHLILSSRVEDLLMDQLDVAIRLGSLQDSSLVAHPLGALQLGVYANPSLLNEQRTIKHPSDLEDFPCIRLGSTETASRWFFSKLKNETELETVDVIVKGRVVAGGPHMATQLTVQGLGVGLLDRRIAQPFVEKGELIELLKNWQPSPVLVHAITLSRLMPARVRNFIELLKAEISKLSTNN